MATWNAKGAKKRSLQRVARGLLVLAGIAGCEEGKECLAYACFTTAHMTASFPWDAASGEFELRLCHGDDCSDRLVQWNAAEAMVCDGDAFAIGDTSACVERIEGELEFSARWTFGEGAPAERTFSFRIVDRGTGAVLLDETREGTFIPSPLNDHCHDCRSASMDVSP